MTKKKTLLVVLTGPTAVGKTTLSIDLAQYFQSEIISCDSRQFYREMNIGTAKVSNEEMQQVPHHFINHLSIEDNYNVSDYEQECIALLESLFEKHPILFLSGGSGLYIDAVCAGIDDLPDIDATLREELWQTYLEKGLEHIQALLEKKDPEYYAVVDKKNPTRLLRALEVCIQSGKKYSSLRKDKKKQRNFDILKIALNREREEVFQRINERVEIMFENGLVEEARNLYPFKTNNALKTVGYTELFPYFENQISLEEAKEKIKTNSRRYAKRQLTWLKKDTDYHWFHPNDKEKIIALIEENIKKTS
jgi:tRNA dimethylallyltransferase